MRVGFSSTYQELVIERDDYKRNYTEEQRQDGGVRWIRHT